jgi:serine/threonine protein kinase
MLRCPDPGCGLVNRPNSRFCARCGRPLNAASQAPDIGANGEGGWSILRSGHLMLGGAYRILEPLGKGGMGALYLAADTAAFDRKCVIKELIDYYNPADPEETRQAQARFETEARLLAELNHPGIPRIYTYFSEAGRHYIVMEYVEGDICEQGVTHVDAAGRTVPARPLPPEVVIRHAIRVCRVLEYLSDRPTPVIHHDIKPANLIVERTSGDVRLVDFGTARIHTRRLLPGEQPALFGTPGYAAPEQYQGNSDPRSDVYSLAATVYHLLTDDDPGDHPFQFPQMDSLPATLADVLGRALRLEGNRRSTVFEFRQGLEAWLIPEGAGRPFVFRSGGVAHTTEDLVALADRYWADARAHLAAGDFQRWFRERNRHDLAAKAESARLEAGENADAALEAFLQRLNPRLAPPRPAVEPTALDLYVGRTRPVTAQLTVRNQGRGYVQAVLSASVPWLHFEPAQVGCLANQEVPVTVSLDPSRLSFRRDHQAVIACTPARGARMSVAVSARFNLAWELLRRLHAGLRVVALRAGLGVRQGWSLWRRTTGSLTKSRAGLAVLVAETVLLDVLLVALWWLWYDLPSDALSLVLAFFQALPLAAVTVFVLPALVFVGGAIIWQLVKRQT